MNSKDSTSWTEEKVDRLKKLWDEGLSASQIGYELGVSRSAVCGKVFRLSLASRSRNFSGRQRSEHRPARKPSPGGRIQARRYATNGALALAVGPDPEPDAAAQRCTILELTSTTCRYPVASAGLDTQFCGGQSMERSPYCRRHHSVAYAGPGARGGWI